VAAISVNDLPVWAAQGTGCLPRRDASDCTARCLEGPCLEQAGLTLTFGGALDENSLIRLSRSTNSALREYVQGTDTGSLGGKGRAMITITKLVVSGAASLFGVALVAGGALPRTAALTIANAPGQVLQVSGVGPSSAHPSVSVNAPATATTLFATHDATHDATHSCVGQVATRSCVGQVGPPAAQPLPAYHAATTTPKASVQPAAPQRVHHSPEPAHSSAGMHMPEHPMR